MANSKAEITSKELRRSNRSRTIFFARTSVQIEKVKSKISLCLY
jgi:hypothetical protein